MHEGGKPASAPGTDAIALAGIIDNESLITHYQPICSVKQQQIIGIEALTRGQDELTGALIPPSPLFAYASEHGQAVEFDRLCRRKALEVYARYVGGQRGHALFLNFDTAVIDSRMAQGAALLDEITPLGLAPHNIVLELREASVHDTAALVRFVENHRQHGFLIALDDIGAGESNLDRISILKPDILKIDRSLVHGIALEYHKQEVLRSLANLAHKIGALAVAEGIESPEDALHCLDAGTDMLQGFFLGRPVALEAREMEACCKKTSELAASFREYLVERIGRKRTETHHFEEVIQSILCAVANSAGQDFDRFLADLADAHADIECIYLLDRDGIQVSSTVMGPQGRAAKLPRLISESPARGTDHSYKDYVFLLRTGLSRYVTEPYISMRSGALSRTVSTVFRSADGQRYILCVDFAPCIA